MTIREELQKLGLTDDIIDSLLKVNFSKFGHLSYKAMKNILPYLEEGKKYDEACKLYHIRM